MSVTHTRAVSCGWILDIFRNYSKQDFQIFLTMPVDQCKKWWCLLVVFIQASEMYLRLLVQKAGFLWLT